MKEDFGCYCVRVCVLVCIIRVRLRDGQTNGVNKRETRTRRNRMTKKETKTERQIDKKIKGKHANTGTNGNIETERDKLKINPEEVNSIRDRRVEVHRQT